jgi:hypothetical protein
MGISTTFCLHGLRYGSMSSACTVRAQCVHGETVSRGATHTTNVQHRGKKPSSPSKPSTVQQRCGFLEKRRAVASRPTKEASYAKTDEAFRGEL